jgi:hypothetical protein
MLQSDASELKTDMKIDIMQRGMGTMAEDQFDHSIDHSESSLLEAAIDQSLVSRSALTHSAAIF